MGSIEQSAKKRREKQNLQKAVLGAIGVTGLLAVAIVAPNALQLLKYLPKGKYQLDGRVRSATMRLREKGLITFETKNGNTYARLTPKGRAAVILEQEKAVLQNRKNGKKKKWDGQWRMVIFDIPERRRAIRLRLTNALREIGFLRLQNSVWVYPYDCEELIALFKVELKTGKDILYGVVAELEYDSRVREYFGLRTKRV